MTVSIGPSLVSPAFSRDRALDPLRRLSGDVSQPALAAYLFYWKRGRLWGSDGSNHTPVNPAILSNFESLFLAANAAFGRGALFALMAEEAAGRNAVFVSTVTLRAEFKPYDDSLRAVLQANLPAESPNLPSD